VQKTEIRSAPDVALPQDSRSHRLLKVRPARSGRARADPAGAQAGESHDLEVHLPILSRRTHRPLGVGDRGAQPGRLEIHQG
jgi:hypothetical protein